MDIISTIQNINTLQLAKIFFLILLGLYTIFIFMLYSKTRSFDKIIILSGKSGGGLIKSILVIYLFLLLFLFLGTLVIV